MDQAFSSSWRDKIALNSAPKPQAVRRIGRNRSRICCRNHRRNGGDKAERRRKSYSAMPGATTARLVFLAAAIAWKTVHDAPEPVPKRPTKGDVEATVARNGI